MNSNEASRAIGDYVPPWACSRWGGYGHDWLDCDQCLTAYEEYLEELPPANFPTLWIDRKGEG
jgi:hypothetical protein